MQYLEGSKDNLDLIYKIIQDDQQHRDLILLMRESLENRQFGDWLMGFQTRDFEDFVSPFSDSRLLEKILSPPKNGYSNARIALRDFWEPYGTSHA